MNVSRLPPRNINGNRIDRFIIQNLHDTVIEASKMGKILFTVEDERLTRYVKYDRLIDVLITNKREVGQEFYTGNSSGDPGDEWCPHEKDEDDTQYEILSRLVNKIEQRRPERSKIVIDELDCDGTLETGTQTVSVKRANRLDLASSSIIYSPKNLDIIELEDGHELSICLYNAGTSNSRWTHNLQGNFLQLDCISINGYQQKFTFSFKKNGKKDTEEIEFNAGKETIRVFVRRVEAEPFEDIDRYYD